MVTFSLRCTIRTQETVIGKTSIASAKYIEHADVFGWKRDINDLAEDQRIDQSQAGRQHDGDQHADYVKSVWLSHSAAREAAGAPRHWASPSSPASTYGGTSRRQSFPFAYASPPVMTIA